MNDENEIKKQSARFLANWLNISQIDLLSVFNQSDRLLLLFAYAISRKASGVIISMNEKKEYHFYWRENGVLYGFDESRLKLSPMDLAIWDNKELKLCEEKLKGLTMNTIALHLSAQYNSETINQMAMSILYYRLDVTDVRRAENIKTMLERALLNYRLKTILPNKHINMSQRKI